MSDRKFRVNRLRPYQCAIAQGVMRSVAESRGDTITVEIARQGGKNEVSAQVETFLLRDNLADAGDAVKCAPTYDPQLGTSMRRLWVTLGRMGIRAIAGRRENAISLGLARVVFLSAEPTANVVGHTASLLLEADEAQDIDIEKFDREFRPMCATTNATTVMYGTALHDATMLEQAKQRNLELQRRDGVRRHFEYDWEHVARYIPWYRAFAEHERERLGETHPTWLTQYCLKPISGGGRLFTAAQRAGLSGWHERLSEPAAGEQYVAGLDLAGGDTVDVAQPSSAVSVGDATAHGSQPSSAVPRPDLSTTVDVAQPSSAVSVGDATAHGSQASPPVPGPDLSTTISQPGTTAIRASRPRRDSTVLTIGRLAYPASDAAVQEPRVEIVEHYAWTGEPHEVLLPRLIDLLRDVWRVHRVCVDATGLGETVSRLLAQALGSARVEGVKFTGASKSDLGYGLLAAVNGGRLKVYRGDGSAEYAEFQRQCEVARAEYRATEEMRWYVADADGHDDYLVSAALLVRASLGRTRRVASGRIRE